MYKFVFFVPDSHVESIKEAIFVAKGGTIGNYSHCAWQVLGEGQFKPLAGSNPFSGEIDTLKKVPEWRVELIVDTHYIHAVVAAMKTAHPYETPAYDIVKLESF